MIINFQPGRRKEKKSRGKKITTKCWFFKKEKHTKQTNKQRPCFFHFLHPWFPHSKLPKTITQKKEKILTFWKLIHSVFCSCVGVCWCCQTHDTNFIGGWGKRQQGMVGHLNISFWSSNWAACNVISLRQDALKWSDWIRALYQNTQLWSQVTFRRSMPVWATKIIIWPPLL